MYKALYRKYRPKDFSEVYGQDVVKKTIINEINNDKISHAYLFCGPRGTGKTSVAKLVAKLINCENAHDGIACNECESCIQINNNSNLDVVEIDAASNNGVDEIRELKDKIKFLPTLSKYKVYIIDEVHMLSMGAFNALLKTLEEPPKHVIFILATTEVHKIPITIISRCQRFDFKKISSDKIYERLKYIASKENIKIEEDALKEISSLTDGGLRDAIGLLDKLISYTDEVITTDIVHTVNYTVTNSDIEKIINYLSKYDIKNYINKINELDDQSKDLVKFVDEIIIRLRDILINSEQIFELNNNEIIKYINFFNDLSIKVKNSNYPKILIETSIFTLNSGKKVPDYKVVEPDKNLSNENINNVRDNNNFNDKETKLVNKSNNDEKVEQQQNIEVGNKELTNNENVAEKEQLKSEIVDKIDADEIEENTEVVNINNFEELKKVRISNTFARANKEKLVELKSIWDKIHEYSVDNVYGIAAGMLIDSELVIASDRNIIVTFPYESMAGRANDIIYLVEYVLEKCFNSEYKFFAVSKDEWDKLKKEYIKNIKNGVQYKYVKENVSYDDILNQDNSIINESIELFGSDLLQII